MNHELLLFFCALWMGICLLFCYDWLRILRLIIPHSPTIVAVTDLLYWIGSGIYIFAVMYQKNDGIIRSYAVLGIILGMALYHFTLSEPFITIAVRIINFPVKIVKKSVKRLIFASRRVRIPLCRFLRKYMPRKRRYHRRNRKKRAEKVEEKSREESED